jgi:DNA helicase HerA-like ATPase
MDQPMDALIKKEEAKHAKATKESSAPLANLVQDGQYVGETLRMDYREVIIQVNDFFRRKVGGIPHLSYLVASRIKPNEDFDPTLEDSSVLLLRVLGSAPMPSDNMDTIVRAEAARRATGREHHWDAQQVMDGYTRNELNYAGLACEIVGTFFLSRNTSATTELRFGTDLSNFYPNTGLKVYKPINEALQTIVNFRDLGLSPEHPLQNFTVSIGRVRYASSNRVMQGVDNVQVSIAPMDLLAQRSALFGMSRTGKSNTTKIIARAIYRLRLDEQNPIRVGQLIMDYNGEYANENTQGGADVTANALKNVQLEHNGNVDDVVTYGLTRPKQDPMRKLLQINAYGNKVRDWNDVGTTIEDLDMLFVGKEILADLLADDPAKYIKNFLEVDLSVPDGLKSYGVQTRYRRQILVYRTLLTRAGLTIPPSLAKIDASILQGPKGSLFSADLIKAMTEKYDAKTKTTSAHEPKFVKAAEILSRSGTKLSWDELANAFESLVAFINQKESGYAEFDADYLKSSSSGQSWADNTLLRLLEMFRYPNGSKAVARLEKNHEPNTTRDFAQQIYDDLKSGKLVIVDQSGGDPLLNDAAAKRIMWAIFKGNQKAFTEGDTPPDLLVYVEEAHNLLPNSSSLDLRDVWVRTAKEGSKYRIGLVYATQEVSSIQRNILKNTANWFIAHLNNSDETKELRKFYDFANFEDSILRAQDRGFLRVKTLSNPYINPVQIEKFVLDIPSGTPSATGGN